MQIQALNTFFRVFINSGPELFGILAELNKTGISLNCLFVGAKKNLEASNLNSRTMKSGSKSELLKLFLRNLQNNGFELEFFHCNNDLVETSSIRED